MTTEFERDMSRYMVIKVADANAALGEEDKAKLTGVLLRVAAYRVQQGKAPLSCVVVESDWPIYQAVWDLVEEQASFDAVNCTNPSVAYALHRTLLKASARERMPGPSAEDMLDEPLQAQKYLSLVQTVATLRYELKYAYDVLGCMSEKAVGRGDRDYCNRAVMWLDKQHPQITASWQDPVPLNTMPAPSAKDNALAAVVAFFEHRADVLGGLSEEAGALLAKVKGALV